MEKQKNIERLGRIKEYENEKRQNELNEKERKQAEYKKQKEKFNQLKQEMSIKLDKEKQEIINKFEDLMKQNKEIQPETIKEMFPDDEDLYEKNVMLNI